MTSGHTATDPKRARRTPYRRTVFAHLVGALLPLSLTIDPLIAGGLAAALILVAPRIRRLPLRNWYPLLGLLAVAGAAALVALVRPAAVLAGVGHNTGRAMGAMALWLGVAAVLVLLIQRLDSRYAMTIGFGSVAAALANAGAGVYQVAWLGQAQSSGFTYHPNLAAAAALVALGGVAVGWRPAWRVGLLGRLALIAGVSAALVALVLTGSRSGLVGLAAGAFWWLVLALPRMRWRPLLVVVVTVALAGVAGLVGERIARGPVSVNLLSNSGFEQGATAWSLNGASARLPLEGEPAVLLSRGDSTAYVLLKYAPVIPVRAGETLLASMGVRAPAAEAEEATRVGVVLAIDAVDEAGVVVARLGAGGWAPAIEPVLGGRPKLVAPEAGWTRTQAVVPRVPSGAVGLTLALEATGQGSAPFGWVDMLQVVGAGESAAGIDEQLRVEFTEVARGADRSVAKQGYAPGQRAGLFGWAQPARARLKAMVNDPTGASGGRLAMWFLGLELAEARPVLGYGPGSELELADAYAARRTATPLRHFHSLYIKALLEGGVLFLGALLLFLGGLLLSLSRGAVARLQGNLAAAALLVALMVQSVFDPVLTLASVAGGVWVVVAVARSNREDRTTKARAEAGEPS